MYMRKRGDMRIYVVKDCKMSTAVKEAIDKVIEDKLEEICDNHACIDQGGDEFIEVDVADLRIYLQELVQEVEEAVHVTMEVSKES